MNLPLIQSSGQDFETQFYMFWHSIRTLCVNGRGSARTLDHLQIATLMIVTSPSYLRPTLSLIHDGAKGIEVRSYKIHNSTKQPPLPTSIV